MKSNVDLRRVQFYVCLNSCMGLKIIDLLNAIDGRKYRPVEANGSDFLFCFKYNHDYILLQI